MKRFIVSILAGLVVLVSVVTGCGATPIPPTPTPLPPPLTETSLKNGNYSLKDMGTIELKDGAFEKKAGEGTSQVSKAGFVTSALGDLNGDGVQDAAVVLSVSTGGSGTFVYLVAVTNNNGQPQQAAIVLVGDREPVKALSIENGKIVATVQAHAAKDPLCCPSQEVVRTYELQGDALRMTAEQVTAPAAALSGRTWTLAALGAPGAEKLLLAGTTVTVTFGADGKLSGSAGCNSFGGGYTADGKNLAVGTLASTKKYCGDITGLMDQESAFLAALASAKTYQVQGNQVVMLDAGGSQILRLKGS